MTQDKGVEVEANAEDLKEETDPDNGPADLYRSDAELRDELARTTEVGATRLIGMARNRARGTKLAAEDLFQEAIMRLLEGRRRWRKDETFAMCIARTMKSLVQDWWRREERVSIRSDADLGKSDAQEVENYEGDEPSALRVMMAREELNVMLAALKDDKNTQEAALMLAEGESPRDVREAYGLSQTHYDTLLKRIVRTRKKVRQAGEAG